MGEMLKDARTHATEIRRNALRWLECGYIIPRSPNRSLECALVAITELGPHPR